MKSEDTWVICMSDFANFWISQWIVTSDFCFGPKHIFCARFLSFQKTVAHIFLHYQFSSTKQHGRWFHRGNVIFAPVLWEEPGQELGFASVTFALFVMMLRFYSMNIVNSICKIFKAQLFCTINDNISGISSTQSYLAWMIQGRNFLSVQRTCR